jgi:hypothetical protein
MKSVIKVFKWVWQFPQHVLAVILVKAVKPAKVTYYNGSRVYYYDKSLYISGVSLGSYILLPSSYYNEAGVVTVKHEYGHSLQSLMLGPLYLLVIGVSSAVFCNWWDRTFHIGWDYARRYKWYYTRWCEAWADRLGGVDRGW